MSDMYLEVLQNYLNGSEWRQSVEMFVASNCKYFQNIGEMDHQQHDIWKRFQDVVEMVLESALDSIGGNIQKLEEALDAVHNQPSRGPRDDLVKDVLERLLSFTDFESFASMMKLAYDNMDGDSDSNAKHVDSLLRMGFRIDAIDAVLGDAPPGSSLEDLVMALSAYVSDNTGASAQAHSYGGDSKYSYDVHDSRPGSSGDSGGNGGGRKGGKSSSKETLSLLKFVKEAAEEGLIIDENELNAKFVIAESVLDSFDRNARAELGPADAMLSLIRWAEDMKMLAHDALLALEEELPCAAMCFNCKDGLVEWYRQLELTRVEMDQSAVAGNMLSDAELHRMAELDKIAAMGTADEQLLHSLIGRHEEVTREVNGLHRQCGLLVASERGIKRENLEELYLYLKQQVASGMDLDAITDELHDHVYSLVSSARGAEVTNLLLDMHIYEDEQHMLKQRIDTLLGIPPGRSEPQVDFLGEEQVQVEGEFAHGEEGRDGRFDQYADDKYSPSAESDSKNAHSTYGVLSPSKQSGGENESPSKMVSPSHGGLGGIGGVNMNIAQRMQHEGQSMFTADGKGATQGDAANTANVGPNGTTTAAVRGAGGNSEAYLGTLKDQHRTSIAQLKELLDSEKARRLKALEDKLMRRRALQQAQQRKGGESKGEEDLAAEHARSVKEVEVEIEEVQTKFDGMIESMVSGLKKRCLNEIMVARKNHEKEQQAGADNKHSGGPLLSEQDRDDAHRAAADSIKQRFERDQKALLDSLERERAKQHERVAKQMAAKRKARLASGASEAAVAAEEQAALNAMNLEFDVMQATALSSAQEHALLALSAIHLTEADLAADKAHSGEEDDYLNEDAVTSSGGSLAKGRDWLDRVDHVKGSYMGAAADLIQRLRVNAVTTAGVVSPGGMGAGDNGQAFGEVAGLMSKVVADAFDNQLLEEAASREHGGGANTSSSKYMKKTDNKSDAARLKAGILEEFERAKRQMDENLLSAQQASKNKLSDRRNKGRAPPGGNSLGAEGKDDDTTTAAEEEHAKQVRLQKVQNEIMEGVVDAFLGGEPVPDIAAAYTAAAAAQSAQQSASQQRRSAEWEEEEREKERARIKNSHAQTEQSLLQDLQANMLEKKRALEDRLRRKRQNGGSSSGHPGAEQGGAETHQQEEEEVNMLNEAFEKLSSQLKGMSKDQLTQLDLNMLMDLMERSANGERVAIPAGSPLKPIMTNATLVRPMATRAEEKQSAPPKEAEVASPSANPNPFSISPTHLAPLPALAPIVPNRRVSVSEEKEAMAGEVKRISLEYNEEKQKLDLMMKIQQARQRQSLQRKLFEKNQRKQQQQRETDGLYEDGDEDEYNEHGDAKSEYNSVEIGANRGLSNLKLKQSTVQPAFRGLPADAYRSGNSGGGGAGYSSGAKPTNQAMALRGMNLGPMMRK